MKKSNILISSIFLTALLSYGSLAAPAKKSEKIEPQVSVQRLKDETAEQLIKRFKPSGTNVIKITKGIIPNSLIAFYGFDDPKDINVGYNKILGYLYYPLTKDKYKIIRFGSIEEEGGYPEIVSIFFANADQDKTKELIVLVKYEQNHYDYSGTFFNTFIYDTPDSNKSNFKVFDKLNEQFMGCECSYRDGRNEKAKYKSETDIRAKLKLLGY